MAIIFSARDTKQICVVELLMPSRIGKTRSRDKGPNATLESAQEAVPKTENHRQPTMVSPAMNHIRSSEQSTCGGAGLGAAFERRASGIRFERKGGSGAARQPCRQMSRTCTRGLSCTARFSDEWQIGRIYKSTAPRTHRVRAPAVTDSVAAHRASIREGALSGGLGWHTTTGGESRSAV